MHAHVNVHLNAGCSTTLAVRTVRTVRTVRMNSFVYKTVECVVHLIRTCNTPNPPLSGDLQLSVDYEPTQQCNSNQGFHSPTRSSETITRNSQTSLTRSQASNASGSSFSARNKNSKGVPVWLQTHRWEYRGTAGRNEGDQRQKHANNAAGNAGVYLQEYRCSCLKLRGRLRVHY